MATFIPDAGFCLKVPLIFSLHDPPASQMHLLLQDWQHLGVPVHALWNSTLPWPLMLHSPGFFFKPFYQKNINGNNENIKYYHLNPDQNYFSLEKEMATHSSSLAWKIPWTEKPGGLQSMRSQRAGHNWAHIQTVYFLWKLALWIKYTLSLFFSFHLLLILQFSV